MLSYLDSNLEPFAYQTNALTIELYDNMWEYKDSNLDKRFYRPKTYQLVLYSHCCCPGEYRNLDLTLNRRLLCL